EAPFVHVTDNPPGTGHVRNTNNCHIYPYTPEQSGKLLIISVIDNLVKGASGQAVQNMNIMFGFPLTAGLL
ncbi:N-acetyl-gamma-glutamyl-phosphate reductase, partial [Fibrobacterota bacterium]